MEVKILQLTFFLSKHPSTIRQNPQVNQAQSEGRSKQLNQGVQGRQEKAITNCFCNRYEK